MDSLSYKTTSVNSQNANRQWLVIDAAGMTLGRLASQIAYRLRGKHKTCYTPHADCGDRIIVINAERVRLTGKKFYDKVYIHHTGYPGGQRERTAQEIHQKNPARIIEIAVRGMLPKTKLGDQIYTNLKVYSGPDHKHQAQNPTVITL